MRAEPKDEPHGKLGCRDTGPVESTRYPDTLAHLRAAAATASVTPSSAS